jgi:undecaprenyl diphosphate synthase
MSADLLSRITRQGPIPRHVAIIMDGNGRWARGRRLPRPLGHRAGMDAVREAVEGAVQAGVGVLTIFAFSEENWQRPATEIAALMELLREFITREGERLRKEGVVVRVFGDLDRLTPPARAAVDEVQRDTAGGQNLALNVCLSYSSRAEITRAARLLAEDVQRGALRPDQIDEPALAGRLYTAGVPDPDLLIRTSGEQRVSNFLLWQLAYTEIYITPVLWPDFSRQTLWEAILDYQRRERRFGKVPVA